MIDQVLEDIAEIGEGFGASYGVADPNSADPVVIWSTIGPSRARGTGIESFGTRVEEFTIQISGFSSVSAESVVSAVSGFRNAALDRSRYTTAVRVLDLGFTGPVYNGNDRHWACYATVAVTAAKDLA